MIREMQRRMGGWSKGESDTVEISVRRHAQKHYFPEGAKPPFDYAQYLEDAERTRGQVEGTWRNKKPNTKSQGGAGTRDLTVGDRHITLDANGKIVNYGYQATFR